MVLVFIPTFGNKMPDEPNYHFIAQIETGIGTKYDTWTIEAKGGYYPIPYFGINMGIKYQNLCRNNECLHIETQGQSYLLDDYSTFMYHLLIHPEVQLNSPFINLDNVGDKVNISIGYGTFIPVNRRAKGWAYPEPSSNATSNTELPIKVKNKSKDTSYYHEVNIAANLISDRWRFTIGYRISNLDVYGAARNVYVNNEHINFEKEKNANEIFISIGYCF